MKVLRLTYERQQKGWTRTQLGFEAKIHPSEIGKLESGKIFAYPKWKIQLGNVFGIPGDRLFEEVEI